MKRILLVVGVLVMAPLLGSGQEESAFFRLVSSTNSRITAFSPDGTLTWTNASTSGVSCVIQRASTLVGPSNWVDYVQHTVTNASMAARIYDPNPLAGMRMIPGGTNAGIDEGLGAYSQTVEMFYMDATKVTKPKWDEVHTWAVSNGYSFDNTGLGKAATHPVHTVNWYDCVKWCNARSQKEGKTPCYTVGGNVYKTGQSSPDCNFAANGYRLPTNTEWGYAARGGLSSTRFPWGNTITHSQANYYSEEGYAYDTSPTRGFHPTYATGAYPYTSPAGAFPANGFGLYDMGGNLWEWCYDTYGAGRIIRGGGWYYSASTARCGNGGQNGPGNANHYFGFRSVCR